MTTKKAGALDVESIEELEEYFSFKIKEKRYVFPLKTREVMNPGFVRQHRRRDQTDYFMTLIEALCCGDEEINKKFGVKEDDEKFKIGEEILKTIDELPWEEHKKLQREFFDHLEVQMGE